MAEVITSENTEPDKVVDLEAQRDYMDMVCRSFASRLERRRNLVISSARFHRLVEQVDKQHVATDVSSEMMDGDLAVRMM